MSDYLTLLNRSIAFYDTVIEHYSLLAPSSRNDQQTLAYAIVELCNTNSYKSLLDIACSTGSLLQLLHTMRPSLRLAGSDAHPRAIERARLALKNIADVFVLDWFNISKVLDNSRYDLVLCTGNSIAHLPAKDRIEVFSRVLGILNQHASFVVDTYADWSSITSETFSLSPRGVQYSNSEVSFCVILNEYADHEIIRHATYLEFDRINKYTLRHKKTETASVSHFCCKSADLHEELRTAGFNEIDFLLDPITSPTLHTIVAKR